MDITIGEIVHNSILAFLKHKDRLTITKISKERAFEIHAEYDKLYQGTLSRLLFMSRLYLLGIISSDDYRQCIRDVT